MLDAGAEPIAAQRTKGLTKLKFTLHIICFINANQIKELKQLVIEANRTSIWKPVGYQYTPFDLIGSAHDNAITYTDYETDDYWDALLGNIRSNLSEMHLHKNTLAFFARRGVRA